jgi:hypothetical protein
MDHGGYVLVIIICSCWHSKPHWMAMCPLASQDAVMACDLRLVGISHVGHGVSMYIAKDHLEHW